MFVDLHHLAHRALPKADRGGQLFAGVHRGGVDFRQCCRRSTLILVPVVRLLVGLCPGLDLRPQFQGDLAQLPFVQVAAALLGVQRPLLGLQQIVKGKHRHLIGQAVPGADLLAVVAVYDDQVLIDDNGRIAAVLQDVLLQRGKLLPAERGEQLRQFRQDGGGAFRTGVFNACIPHGAQAAASSMPSAGMDAAFSSTRRGDRNSTSVALMRKPG